MCVVVSVSNTHDRKQKAPLWRTTEIDTIRDDHQPDTLRQQ